MTYADYLLRLLQPLGVYSFAPGSCSGAALRAEGAQLDAVQAVLDRALREGIPATAEAEGLARMESLMVYAPSEAPAVQRRKALMALLRVGDDSFTHAALTDAIQGCGVAAELEETGPLGTLIVRFPGIYGRPAQWSRARQIVDGLLPAHLEVEYRFRWILWRELHEDMLSWRRVGTLSWYAQMSRAYPH